MADSATVGILKTLLTMDSSSYESGAKKAVQTDQTLRNSFKQTGEEIKKITPLAERMVKSFEGGKLLYTANSLVQAVEKLGGASRLTEANMARVNKTMTDAIAHAKLLGEKVPQSWVALQQATQQVQKPLDAVASGMARAGREATASAKLIAGMGASGRQAMDQLAQATQRSIVQQSNFSAAIRGTLGRLNIGGISLGAGIGGAVGGFFGAAAVTGIQAVAGALGDVIAKGPQLMAVSQSFEGLTRGINQSSAAMLNATRGATKGLIADLDLMLATNKAILLGLPVTTSEMAVLARTAVVLGKAMGLDATTALDNLVTALGRSSPLILDNLGLMVKEEEAHERYAKSLGKSASQLTDAEKKTAFYNEAMEKARIKTGQLGDQNLTASENIKRLGVALGNVAAEASGAANQSGIMTRATNAMAESAERAAENYNLVNEAIDRLEKQGKNGIWRSIMRGAGFGDPALLKEIDKIVAETQQSAMPDNPLHGGELRPKSATQDDINLVRNYALEVLAAQAELKKLNSAQIEDIESAQQLGASDAALIERLKQYGVEASQAENVLRIFTGTMKDADAASKKLKKSQDELNDANMRWLDILGKIEEKEIAEKIARSRSLLIGDREHKSNAADDLFKPQPIGPTKEAIDKSLDDMKRALDQMEKGESEWRQFQNFIGERELEDEAERLKRRKEEWIKLHDSLIQIFAPVLGGAIRGVGAMLFGIGNDDAKRHYEALKASGKATAEELTRAFEAWRHAEINAWTAFTNAVKNMLNNLFNHIVNNLMGGLVDAALGTKWGQSIATGGLARLLGFGGTVAATTATAAATTAAAAGTSALTVGSGVVAGLNAQVGATAVATGAGGAGLGATLAGLATNPITIGAAVAIAGGLLLKKLGFFDNGPGDLSRSIRARMLTRQGVPQSQWPDWVREDTSTMARFTAPDISMPSPVNVLNGSGLVSQTPFAQAEASHRFGRTVHVTVNVSTIDAKGVRDFVRSREFGNAFAFSMEQNDQQRTSRTRRAFNP